jgi:1-acyl-sn-glycerol-3-phosphate acyltransferase
MTGLKTVWLGLRATLFWLGFAGSTIFLGLFSPLLLLVSYKVRYPLVIAYSRFNVWWLKISCGLSYQVIGKGNIPDDQTLVIMPNHQSTWETLAFASIFPPLTWVLKKELLRIPFFGWGLKMIRPIAIDRNLGRSAIIQVKDQGKQRLDNGTSLIIFPEGTRVVKGRKQPYKKGGAVLAVHAKKNVLPVAHNAGEFWPRRSYIKKAGVITISIGELIHTQGLSPEEILAQVKTWIDKEKQALSTY